MMRLSLLDVASDQPLGTPLTGHTDEVNSVTFSPDGKTLADGGIEFGIGQVMVEHQHLPGPAQASLTTNLIAATEHQHPVFDLSRYQRLVGSKTLGRRL